MSIISYTKAFHIFELSSLHYKVLTDFDSDSYCKGDNGSDTDLSTIQSSFTNILLNILDDSICFRIKKDLTSVTILYTSKNFLKLIVIGIYLF